MEKKVLFIINHYSSNSDQHLFHTLNLMKRLGEKGINVAVIFERVEGDLPFIHDNVIVYGQRQKHKVLRILELLVMIRKNIKDGYDKIYVRISKHTAICAALCTKIYGGETFYWHSGTGFELINEVSGDKKKDLKKGRKDIEIIGRVVDHFITGPESMRAYYHKWCNIPFEKIGLMYNDIDTDRFKPVNKEEKSQLRNELGLESDKIYVLFVHRFSPIRRTEFYIPYCLEKIQYKNLHFLLIGNGPEETKIRQLINKANLCNVTFLGAQPNAIIQKYYCACDIFFNPTFCEGFPRVIIEAMGCGMPIVTTNAGGTLDLFDSYQRSFVSDVENRELLAKNLIKMIDNEECRKICSDENIKRVKKYSTDVVSDMYIQMFWPKESIRDESC